MKLKEIRTKRGLSQRDLAKIIGKKQPYIAFIEAGELAEGTALSTIMAFNKALGCVATIDSNGISFAEK